MVSFLALKETRQFKVKTDMATFGGKMEKIRRCLISTYGHTDDGCNKKMKCNI